MAWVRGWEIELDGVVYHLCLIALGGGAGGMGGIPRIHIDGVTYDIFLVDLADPNASPVRIETTIGTKSVRHFPLCPPLDVTLTISPVSVYSLCVLPTEELPLLITSPVSLCVTEIEELPITLTSVYSLAVVPT